MFSVHAAHHAHSAGQAGGQRLEGVLSQAMEVDALVGGVQQPKRHKPGHKRQDDNVEERAPGESLRRQTVQNLHRLVDL